MKAKLLFSSILILMLNVVLAKSVTNLHTKNTLDPIVTMTGDATICPGNSAILTIIGTPNSIVTITNSNFFVYTAFIPQSGTVLFTTPILQETTTFSIIEIKEFATQITTQITDVSVTISVIANGCTNVNVTVQNDNPLICNVGECVNLTAIPTPVPSTTSYEVSSIPYCPQAPFNDPSFIQFPLTADDTYSPVFNLPFNFCFYGNNFSSVQIGDNGVISFGTSYTPNSSNQNAYSQTMQFSNPAFPNNGTQGEDSPFRNMICGVYQDTNSAIFPPTGTIRSVNYQLIGVYPCRKLIVNFNLGQFNCGYNNGEQSSQIVLYEISNIVEVYVKNRTPCNTWQDGRGVIGIKGSGANPPFVVAPGRDSGNWTAANEAWRFTPNGPDVPYSFQWLENGTPISTDLSIAVCPTETRNYVANATYDLCGTSFSVDSNNAEIYVRDYQIQDPSDLTVCFNSESNYTTDLTQNNAAVLGNLNPIDFDVYYFTTLEDATNFANPISNPVNYSFTENQTIYIGIFDIAFNCTNTKSFNLIILEDVLPPTGESTQYFIEGQTLNDLIVIGENINWYDAPEGGNLLLGTTLVQDNTTYYASQTVNNCESRMAASDRLAVLVTSSLNTDNFELSDISISPNPFNDFVTFNYKNTTGTLEIFTILGQKMNSYKLENGQNTINLNTLSSGVYFFKISSENRSKSFKLVKK